MKLLNGASDWKVSADLKTSLQFPVHIIQTEKRPDMVAWSDLKKTVPLIELTVPRGRKPGGSTRAEEKTDMRHCVPTACRLRGKRLDMPCDSYWGWLSWFSRTLSHFFYIKFFSLDYFVFQSLSLSIYIYIYKERERERLLWEPRCNGEQARLANVRVSLGAPLTGPCATFKQKAK